MKGARKFDKAIGSYRRALELKPDLADAFYNSGNSLTQLRSFDEAVVSFQSALRLRPNWAEAHCNLGNVLEDRGNLAEAIVCYRRAIELRDSFVDAHNNLGTAYKLQGMLDEAIACYRRALEINPGYAGAHSNLLYTSQYQVNATLSRLAESHAEYDCCHAIPLRNQWRPPKNDRDPNRRLRIGFLSPDLGRHPVGQFLIRGFEKLDRNQYETICYSDRLKKDDVTKRFQEASSIWREVIGWSDQEVAERVAADRIDILIDLAGHTANNRLLVFARKPAPIQITWIGYEGTTGLSAMDYILADEVTIPLGSERFYKEQVLRTPRGYVCYDPPQGAPEASPLPALKNGFVRFGSFNNPAKITQETIQVWANVLERVPQSKLLLKYRGLGDGTVIKRYLDRFTALGVSEAQLEFEPQSDYGLYLSSLAGLDIALDPIPFGGGITTCDTLWMGVPVITCPGETFASRHSMSHMMNAGLTETIASDWKEYVEIAVSLATDLTKLATLRSGLRERMANSTLCNDREFSKDLISIFRQVWHRWCGDIVEK